VLALVTLVNLRGTRESGLVFAGPTYVFVLSLGFVLAAGAWEAWTGGSPTPVVAPPAVPDGTEAVTLWLLLRAFAAGCTAMTGVEAVSNGVGAFKEPCTLHAHRTLAAIVVVLGLLLLGIAYVARAYGVMAMDETKEGYQSVLSQLAAAVWGRGWLYYVTIGSVLAVLCLSANTSFVGFPRLCRQVAHDGFLPHAFAVPGRRLVYTAGILFLAGGAGLLLVAFGGITDRLIPLFAVGAFLSFTMSQAGMAMHWRREGRGHADRARLGINGLGALATGAALAIILAAKFTEGAWLTIVVIPATLVLLRVVHRYYANLDHQLLSGRQRSLDLREHAAPLVIIPTGGGTGSARRRLPTPCGCRRTSPRSTAPIWKDRTQRSRKLGSGASGAATSSSPRGKQACLRRICWSCPRPTAACSLPCCEPSRTSTAGIPAVPLRSFCRSWSRRAGGSGCCIRIASGACGRRCSGTGERTSPSSACPGNWRHRPRTGSLPRRSRSQRSGASRSLPGPERPRARSRDTPPRCGIALDAGRLRVAPQRDGRGRPASVPARLMPAQPSGHGFAAWLRHRWTGGGPRGPTPSWRSWPRVA